MVYGDAEDAMVESAIDQAAKRDKWGSNELIRRRIARAYSRDHIGPYPVHFQVTLEPLFPTTHVEEIGSQLDKLQRAYDAASDKVEVASELRPCRVDDGCILCDNYHDCIKRYRAARDELQDWRRDHGLCN